MLLCSQFMRLGYGTHTHKCTRAVGSHVLPALLVIPQTNYNVFSSSSFPLFSFSISLAVLPPSSCNWIWIKMAFPFLRYSSLLWLKRDLPAEITHNYRHTYTHKLTDCSADTLHLRKNIFTNKQHPHPPHYSDKLHSQRSTTSPAFAVFHCFFISSHTLCLNSFLSLLHYSLSPSRRSSL